jgi:magnesium chelatase subunit D
LNVPATLRAAAPWQRLRADPRAPQCAAERPGARIAVRREDYRVTRFKRREASTAIFVVDASGSSAMHRLAEAKGAVELLLAQCYVRRDRVALVAFRGQSAEVLLAPTRSLVRARRSLAALPGGGGTPLAAGIDQAAMLADSVRRRGETPLIVLMTDARANVARDGAADPQRAEEEALQAAGALRRNGFAALLIDTSPRPRPVGERFAAAMGARYLPLPYADSVALSQVVGAARGERTADVPQLRGST